MSLRDRNGYMIDIEFLLDEDFQEFASLISNINPDSKAAFQARRIVSMMEEIDSIWERGLREVMRAVSRDLNNNVDVYDDDDSSETGSAIKAFEARKFSEKEAIFKDLSKGLYDAENELAIASQTLQRVRSKVEAQETHWHMIDPKDLTEKDGLTNAQAAKALSLIDRFNKDKCWVDPEDCGCTDCCVGYSRPANDHAEYLIAKKVGIAR